VLDVLAQAEMFKGIPFDGLAQLARNGIKRNFSSGSELMRQGDISDAMYVILAGRVRVERTVPQMPEPVVLAELGPGQVVGEMGLLDHEPRSATVTAIEDTEAVELDDLALAQTVLRYPEVGTALLKLLSERLRSTDELAMELLRRARGDEPLQ
jgi:CRP-like cAMP-binding protein